jgi:hypothetical protein
VVFDALAAKKSRPFTPRAGWLPLRQVFFGALLFLCDLFLFGARDARTSTTAFVATGQQLAAMMLQQKGTRF